VDKVWKLYDDLYIGIPSGIRITGCVVGSEWTVVQANGNTGIARTLELPGNPEKFQAGFIGAYLRETANHMKWDNLALASVGVAAMNAWYNTQERAEGLSDLGDAQPPENAIVINADALITRELPKLLNDIGEDGNVILEGYSLPCSALFFAFGMPVRELRGFYSLSADKLLACAINSKDPAPGVLPFTVRNKNAMLSSR
jgi:hypothetical protein